MRADNNEYIRNQCSLIIRVDGDELEIPVTFGMTSDEIRALYPFLLPILNQKIENPMIQFNREEKRGVFADLSKEEYTAKLMRVVKQAKFWYDKSDAGLLDIAVRFACDLKLKGIAELSSIFGLTQDEAISVKPVTHEEAIIIMRQLNLTDEEPISQEDDDTAEFADEQAVYVNMTPVARAVNVDALVDSLEDTGPFDIKEQIAKDIGGIDKSYYVKEYEPATLSEDDIENGLLKSSRNYGETSVVDDDYEELDGTPVIEEELEYDVSDDDEYYDDDDFEETDFMSAGSED